MKTKKDQRIEKLIRQILIEIGENPDREGLRGTPDRICRMFKEIYRGYDPAQKPKITTFDNGKDGIVYDNMVVDSGDFVSKCVPGFQFVNTVGGAKAASKVKVGDKMWTIAYGIPTQTSVTKITTHTVDKIVKLTLSNGKTLCLTPDHPVKAGKWWIEAQWAAGEKIEYINPKMFNQQHYYLNVCKELGYILAVVAAECSVQEDRRICLETENEQVVDKFITSVKKVFGKKVNKEVIVKPSSFTQKKIKQFRARFVSSEITRRIMKMLGLPYSEIGCGSKTTLFHLPDIVRANYDCWRGFLEGYLDTDGSRYRGKNISYDRIMSANKAFIKELTEFIGHPFPSGRKSKVSTMPVYDVNISKRCTSEEWFDKHGFRQYEKSIDLGETEQVEVVSVEWIEKRTKVYSFTCDKSHTFCVSGVLTHNCEHHMVFFWGKYWFAYIPNPKGKILGLSKIARVVDYCAARLQLQERLVHDVIDMIKTALGTEYPPLGIALVMKAHHGCKEFRGVKKKGVMTASYIEGAFRDDPIVREEFMHQIGNEI